MKRPRVVRVLFVAAVIAVPAYFVFEHYYRMPIVREFNRRLMHNKFFDMGLAFHNYHDSNFSYPAASIKGADGTPLLSWRVSILPFVEEGELYKKFHLDEPWSSPHNRALLAEMPDVFKIPFRPSPEESKQNEDGMTRFLAPVGNDTVFTREAGLKQKDIIDGVSNTVFFVFVAPDRAVPWTKPDDWDYDDTNPMKGLGTVDNHLIFANGDGGMAAVPLSYDRKKLHGFFTYNGGEKLNWSDLKKK